MSRLRRPRTAASVTVPRPAARACAAAVALLATALAPRDVAAQRERAADPRWRPFVGCWTPEDAADLPRSSQEPVTCIVPDGARSVRVISLAYAGGPVLADDRITADGSRTAMRASTGCTGWEQGTWSEDGERLLLAGEAHCDGRTRTGSGMLTMLADDIWLDVRALRFGEREGGLQVRRFLPALGDVLLPDGTRIAARALATGDAAARRPIGAPEIIEASRGVDSVVVEAWLTERREGIALDRRTLAALVRARVPVRTIDMLVALQHPEHFTVHKAGDLWAERATELATRGRPSGGGIASFGDTRPPTSIFPWSFLDGGWRTPGFVLDPAWNLGGPNFVSSWAGFDPRLAAWTNFNTLLVWPWDGPLRDRLVPIFTQTVGGGAVANGGYDIGYGAVGSRARPAIVNGEGYTRDGTSMGSFISPALGGESGGSGSVTGGAVGGGASGGGGGRTAMPRPGSP
jgi:hypothetical protein